MSRRDKMLLKKRQGIVRSRSAGYMLAQAFTNALMILVTILALYPLIWMILSSLKTEREFANNQLGLPSEWAFSNYARAWHTANMDTAVINSLIVTLCSVTLVMILSFLIAYMLNRYRFRGRGLVYGVFLLGMMIPAHSFIIPVYIEFVWLKMLDRLLSLVLIDTAFAMPFSIILIENFLSGVPSEIDEATIIDGATLPQRMFYVVAPMCRPILMTVLILQAMWIWNEFPFALTILTSIQKRTLPITIVNFKGEHTVDYTAMFAALVLVSIPIIVIYSTFSEKIMEGMTAGSIKG